MSTTVERGPFLESPSGVAATEPAVARPAWLTKPVALFRLVRLSTSAVAGVVVTVAGSGDGIAFAGAALALTLAGAFAFNDVVDREADAVNVPGRPIPSGAISVRLAMAIAALCNVAALGFAFASESPRVVVLTLSMMAILILYSLRLERILGVKNLVMALIGASVPLFGAWSAEAGALALTIGLFILQKEIVADVVDRSGDARVGVQTIPVRFGVAAGLCLVTAVNGLFLFSTAALPSPVNAAIAVAALLNVILAALIQRSRDPRSVLRFLRLQQALLVAGVLLVWL